MVHWIRKRTRDLITSNLNLVLSYFQNADLQNQARRRIPSLYNTITLVDPENVILGRIQFFHTRSEQPISTSTNVYFEETVVWERFMEAIFNTPSYVRPTRRVIIGMCSALRVPHHRDDDESDGGPAYSHQRAISIFRGDCSIAGDDIAGEAIQAFSNDCQLDSRASRSWTDLSPANSRQRRMLFTARPFRTKAARLLGDEVVV